jgi:hypothetical protein
LRAGHAQDFVSPRSNDRFTDDEEEQWVPRYVTHRGLGEHEDRSREAGYGGFEDVENIRPSVSARRGGLWSLTLRKRRYGIRHSKAATTTTHRGGEDDSNGRWLDLIYSCDLSFYIRNQYMSISGGKEGKRSSFG